MVNYFCGEDTFGAREAITELAAEAQATLHFVERDELDRGMAAALTERAAGGLFGVQVPVVCDATTWPVNLQTDLVKAVRQAAGTFVLWDRGRLHKTTPIFKAFGGEAKLFPELKPAELAEWLMGAARERGGVIERPAADLLVERAGNDRWRLLNELEKLLAARDEIKETDVRAAVPATERAEIFAMLEALAAGRRELAVKNMLALLAAGEGEFYILSMLAYQFRTLLTIRQGLERGERPDEIARLNGLKPYAVQKNYPRARDLPAEFWRAGLTRILATDFAIRRGKIDQRTALVMLVLSLLAATRQAARS